MGKDYYKILNVPKNATDAQLKSAYRKLAVQWHPDKHKDDKDKTKAEDMFKDISEAYDVLSDKQKRNIYDQVGEEGLKQGGVPGGDSGGVQFVYQNINPEEIFSRVFREQGGGFGDGFGDDFNMGDLVFTAFQQRGRGGKVTSRGGQRQRMKAPSPCSVELPISLEEAYHGCTKKMKVTRRRFHDNGQEYRPEIVLAIDVKAGWKDGTKITFEGEGDQVAPNGPAGSIIFVVKTKEHDLFKRNGSDIIYNIRIPLAKALTGFVLPVQTLDRKTIQVEVNEVVYPDFEKIVYGEGLPVSKSPRKGNLIIRFSVVFPSSLTQQQKESLKRIL